MTEHLAWYWRRLRAMSLREAAARSRRTLAHSSDAAAHRVSHGRWERAWYPPVDRLLAAQPLTEPVGFLTVERAEFVSAHLPHVTDAVMERAEMVCEGRFRFFGYPEARVPLSAVDVDPVSGVAWPDRHAKRLDYRTGEIGDPKWIWELNRCQEMPLLVAAWLLSNEERFGRTASERLDRWVASHPPGRGIAWSNGFEAGLRAISLATTFDALRGSGLIDAAATQRVLRGIWQHGRWIERDPSLGSSANNHRIGELVGLVVIGSLLPELRDADRWLEMAVPELEREAAMQIHADGTSVEQAFAYHLFVVDLLLIASAVLESTRHAVPPGVTGAIARSADALWVQLDDGEPAPTYGDSDDGRALVLDANPLRSPHGVAAGIASCVVSARAVRVAGHPDPTSLWLFGADGVERFGQAVQAEAPGSRTLPNGGISVLRAAGRRVMVDHGQLGYLTLAAHGHADALTVDIAVGQDRLVVDPGVGSYFARPELRSAFRGTGFHATMVVDDVDSSEPGGPFLWTRHAVSRVIGGGADAGFIVMEHDGYERLADPVRHRRVVVAPGDDPLVIVIDRLDAQQWHRYSQRWPLHPELAVEPSDDDRVIASGREAGIVIATTASQPHTIHCVRGVEHPPGGWWSGRLESIEPSWLVSVGVEAIGPLEIATVLVPFSLTAPNVAIALHPQPAGQRVEVEVDNECALVVELDLAPTSPWVRTRSAARTS